MLFRSHFDVGVFTNLTRDHLDYHGDLKTYGEAKLRLFELQGLGAAVVNLDDPFSASILGRLVPGAESLGYSLRDEPRARVRARSLEIGPQGVRMEVVTPVGEGVLASEPEIASGDLSGFAVLAGGAPALVEVTAEAWASGPAAGGPAGAVAFRDEFDAFDRASWYAVEEKTGADAMGRSRTNCCAFPTSATTTVPAPTTGTTWC